MGKKYNVGVVKLTESCFEWKIPNFPTAYDKVQNFISSPTFSTSTFQDVPVEWNLRLYPRGNQPKNRSYLSVFIEYLPPEDAITKNTAEITISILDKDGCRKNEKKTGEKIFDSQTTVAWGFPQFVSRQLVMDQNNKLLSGSTLTILCQVSVKSVPLGGRDVKISYGTLVDDHRFLTSHRYDLESLLENGDYSDVTFITDGGQIKAHKVFITRCSTVFEIMFQNDMKETRENVIEVSDIKFDVMKELLRFIYVRKVKNFQKYAADLLLAAEKYSIKRLKVLCERELAKDLKFEDVFMKLQMASMCNAEYLQSQTIDYVSKNLPNVVDKPEFQEFFTQHRKLISEFFPELRYSRRQKKYVLTL